MKEIPKDKEVELKRLRLISPQKAFELTGTPYETPVFVSRFADKKICCDKCQTEYTPLVYNVGSETKSQHFHENDGGIYYYKGPFESFQRKYYNLSPKWIAVVEPEGNNIKGDYNSGRDIYTYRSESVKVTDLRVTSMWSNSRGVLYYANDGYTLLPAPLNYKTKIKPVSGFEITDRGIRFPTI